MINNKWKILFIIIFCLVMIIVSLKYISHITFNCTNSLEAGIGLIKVSFINFKYVIIQENPRIIMTKPKNSFNELVEYMDTQGYTIIDRMGSTAFFENDMFEKQLITLRINRYCSIWLWN
jgi:hypothetical protein